MRQLNESSANIIRMAMGDDVQCTTIEREDGHVVAIAHLGDIPEKILTNVTDCVVSNDYMITTLLPYVLDSIPDAVWVVTDKAQLSSSLAGKVITCFESGKSVDFKKDVRSLLGNDVTIADKAIVTDGIVTQLAIVDTGTLTSKEIEEVVVLFSSGLKSDRVKAKALLNKPTDIIWDWSLHGTINYISLINRVRTLASFKDPRRILEGEFELSVTAQSTMDGVRSEYKCDNLEFKLVSSNVPKNYIHQINVNAIWTFRDNADRLIDGYIKHTKTEVNNTQATKIVIPCNSSNLFKAFNIVAKSDG